MDMITATQLMPVLTPLLDGAMEGIGGQAWDALSRLIHARHHKNPQLESAMQTAIERPDDTAAVSALASALETLARTDVEFSAELRAWYLAAAKTASNDTNMNINTGEVKGPLFQTQTISGGIHLGVPPTKGSES